MPKKLIVVRHGETDFNVRAIHQGQSDTFLNQTGLEQAIQVANRLVNEKIDVLYSSDLKRAFQTAQIISQKLKLTITASNHLRERSFGDFEGLTIEETQRIISFDPHNVDYYDDPISRLYNVESSKDMINRIQKFLKRLKAKHKGKNVLLVTHGGVIRGLFEIFNEKKNIKDDSKHFSNTAVTFFEKSATGYKILQ